jgi:hypothetical protein
MKRPTQSYSRAQLQAAIRRQSRQLFLIGLICICVGVMALVVFFMRGGF